MSETFFDTRLQVHWAAQAAAGVGRTLLAPIADDSHTNFEWSRAHRALMQGPIEDGMRAGIRLRDFTLLLVRDRGLIEDEFPLKGRTLDDAYEFYESRFGKKLARGDDGIPHHAVSTDGAAFHANDRELARLDRLYDDADFVLQSYRARRQNVSEVRCWPHHFDIAALQSLGDDKTIGAGFVPGDSQYREPYWYVTPSPVPENASSLPALPIGVWDNQGWFGAVLVGERTRDEAAAFLDAATSHFAPIVNTRLPG